jgi:hypothetical protein
VKVRKELKYINQADKNRFFKNVFHQANELPFSVAAAEGGGGGGKPAVDRSHFSRACLTR